MTSTKIGNFLSNVLRILPLGPRRGCDALVRAPVLRCVTCRLFPPLAGLRVALEMRLAKGTDKQRTEKGEKDHGQNMKALAKAFAENLMPHLLISCWRALSANRCEHRPQTRVEEVWLDTVLSSHLLSTSQETQFLCAAMERGRQFWWCTASKTTVSSSGSHPSNRRRDLEILGRRHRQLLRIAPVYVGMSWLAH